VRQRVSGVVHAGGLEQVRAQELLVTLAGHLLDNCGKKTVTDAGLFLMIHVSRIADVPAVGQPALGRSAGVFGIMTNETPLWPRAFTSPADGITLITGSQSMTGWSAPCADEPEEVVSMKHVALLGLAVVCVWTLVAPAVAASEVTVSGSVACAMCTLKKADAKACQDVLVVKDDKGATTEYYITKNEVSEKFGHVCKGERGATVTGTVSEKDGKTWITPTKIEQK
jgi:hypothetical protein